MSAIDNITEEDNIVETDAIVEANAVVETAEISDEISEETDEELEEIHVPPEQMEAAIEGILFALGDSVAPEKIAKAIGVEKKEVIATLEAMKTKWDEENRGVRILELDGAYQMCTDPQLYEYLIRIAKQPKKYALTEVLLETLSIIAYKQPITKSEIEKIRGVSCEHAVSKLVEYQLVTELGRLDAPGRPMLFGTTEDFLRSFGVASIEDLPTLNPVQVEEFKQQAEEEIEMKLEV